MHSPKRKAHCLKPWLCRPPAGLKYVGSVISGPWGPRRWCNVGSAKITIIWSVLTNIRAKRTGIVGHAWLLPSRIQGRKKKSCYPVRNVAKIKIKSWLSA